MLTGVINAVDSSSNQVSVRLIDPFHRSEFLVRCEHIDPHHCDVIAAHAYIVSAMLSSASAGRALF